MWKVGEIEGALIENRTLVKVSIIPHLGFGGPETLESVGGVRVRVSGS